MKRGPEQRGFGPPHGSPSYHQLRALIKRVPFDQLATLASSMATAFDEVLGNEILTMSDFSDKQWQLERRWRLELLNALDVMEEGDA